MRNILSLFTFILIIVWACDSSMQNPNATLPSPIDPANFDYSLDDKLVMLFTLKNKAGITCQITNYGGRVVSLWTPDRNGNFEDIVLGHDYIQGYIGSNEKYYGALIGRYGNRIGKGSSNRPRIASHTPRFHFPRLWYSNLVRSEPHTLRW